MKTATSRKRFSTKPISEPQPTVAKAPGTSVQKGKAVADEAVRLSAYLKWESAGKPAGDGVQFWLEAEQELVPSK